MKRNRIIGLMSGSSLDGVDLASVRFPGSSPAEKPFELERFECIPYPHSLKTRLAAVATASTRALLALDAELGRYYGTLIKEFDDKCDNCHVLAGVHGHTVYHNPEEGYSLQLGSGSQIARWSGLPVVCDFRNADIAVGGQGAPMAPLADFDLFAGYDAYLNIGGIANIGYRESNLIRGYDICPANQLLNAFAAREGMKYDEGGRMASRGGHLAKLEKLLLSFPYYSKEPPKSLDNATIRKALIDPALKMEADTADLLHTATHHIARQITRACSRVAGSRAIRILVTGGGARNEYLMSLLNRSQQGTLRFVKADDRLIDAKEAVLMAYCAFLRLEERPNFIASVTGARTDTSAGAVYLPN